MRRHSRLPFAAALAALALMPAAAIAEQSTYTPLDLERCPAVPPDAADPVGGPIWTCEGYQGIAVRVAEGDLRYLVSYGPTAADEIAAGQTIPPFNTIGTTLEWRLDDAGQPFATILRYFGDSGDGRQRQYLVVTRLGAPGAICHAAYVSVTGNAEPNALAREAADTLARNFRCGVDEAGFYGNDGGGF